MQPIFLGLLPWRSVIDWHDFIPLTSFLKFTLVHLDVFHTLDRQTFGACQIVILLFDAMIIDCRDNLWQEK